MLGSVQTFAVLACTFVKVSFSHSSNPFSSLRSFEMSVGSTRILYVEDDADTRELVTVLLTFSNCEVVATADHDEALFLAGSRSFDLYLLDNWLPDKPGTDLCRQLREFDRETPILFYSGAAFQNDKDQAFLSGAQGYLVKPAYPDELISEVFRLIGNTRSIASRRTAE